MKSNIGSRVLNKVVDIHESSVNIKTNITITLIVLCIYLVFIFIVTGYTYISLNEHRQNISFINGAACIFTLMFILYLLHTIIKVRRDFDKLKIL